MVQQIGELLSVGQQLRKSSADVWQSIAASVDGMDRTVFVQLIGDLWEGMGRKEPPGATLLKMWYITLRAMTAEQLGRAIVLYLESKADEYITPKLLLELGGVTDPGDVAGIAAWDQVLEEIKRVGGYQTPTFTDSRTAAAIKHLGGWVRVCDTEPEELHKWLRQNFLKTFSAMPRVAAARLTNLIELENARTGQPDAAEQVQRRIAESGRVRLISEGL